MSSNKTYNYYPKGSESQRLHEGSQTIIIVPAKVQPEFEGVPFDYTDGSFTIISHDNSKVMLPFRCPLGQPGSIIHVKEAWQLYFHPHEQPTEPTFIYKSEGTSTGVKWRSPVTMPLEAVRTKLRVIKVTANRVQELTEDDAKIFGMKPFTKDGVGFKYGLDGWNWSAQNGSPYLCTNYAYALEVLITHQFGSSFWESNSWVWCIEVEKQ